MIAPRQSGRIVRSSFGTLETGESAELIAISNAAGASVEIITYGAIIRSIRVPDRHGTLDDVVLGYDTLEEYRTDRFFLGALVGRFANRIAAGRFELDGRTYQLPVNEGANHLHGGPAGFHKRFWRAEPLATADGQGIRLSRVSADGEMGYPGTLHVAVDYIWTDAHELLVHYHGTCDQPTPINLTQHSYFNLAGSCSGNVLGHHLRLSADHVLAVDDAGIPLAIEPVADTKFDFGAIRPIGDRYDHCFVLRNGEGELTRAARVYEVHSGRTLEVLTTEPGLQFYTGQHLEPVKGKYGCAYDRLAGLCLETQHFPDSPNRTDFPSTTLRPEEQFRSTTIFRFGTQQGGKQ